MPGVALVIIDVQRDFLDPTTPAGVGSWQKSFCVPGLRRLLAHARDKDWQVVHIGTSHKEIGTLPPHLQRQGSALYCEEGKAGCDFIVEPITGERTLYKSFYSAFIDTRLEKYLSGVTDVVFAGIAADCCILQSAFDADRLGFRASIPLQAISASKCEAFVFGLTTIAKSAGQVFDLTDIFDDVNIPSNFFDPEDVEQHARAWFQKQEFVIRDQNTLTLETVIRQLAEAAG